MDSLLEELYDAITQSVPIVCVDIIPVRKHKNDWEIGIIERATGQEAGKPAILGGRIQHGEQIEEAIRRHMQNDWSITSFDFFEGLNAASPFYVQQYMHAASSYAPFGYDQTKHAVALTYLVNINQKPAPHNEASKFMWISKDQQPAKAAYNQQFVMHAAFEFLSVKSG